MSNWQLFTEASPEVGLGHLSRMCGLAAALWHDDHTVELNVNPGTLDFLYTVVGADVAFTWLGQLAYRVRNLSDSWLLLKGNRVVDTFYGRFAVNAFEGSVGLNVLFSDYGPIAPDHTKADVVVRPHNTRMEVVRGSHALTLAGVQYMPLRRPFWPGGSAYRYRKGVYVDGRLPADPLPEEKLARSVEHAATVYTFVGVRMYEAIAMGVPVVVVARDDEEAALASTLPIHALHMLTPELRITPTVIKKDPVAAELNHYVSIEVSQGARTLARRLVELAGRDLWHGTTR